MKEKFADRLMKFVEEHGGVRDVAEVVDVSPQTFYTMRRRGSLPNLSFLYSLKENFNDLDINWLLFGDKAEDENDPIKQELENVKRELAREKTISNMLLGKSRGEVLCPGVNSPFGKIVFINGNRRYRISPSLTHGSNYAIS
jgi:hypothetical protein